MAITELVASVSGKKLLPFLGVAGIAYFCVALFVAKNLGDPARALRAELTADAGAGVMSEEERQDYVKRSVKVEDFTVERSPQNGGRAGARVRGLIRNTGTKPLHAATLTLTAKDTKGTDLSTFQEDVVGSSRLDPGQARPFDFQIPDKAEYDRFEPKLR